VSGILLLLFGIGFLLADWGKWDFWGIHWWTAFFILVGIASVGMSMCSDCRALCTPQGKMEKRK
jgi:hypothetical protein